MSILKPLMRFGRAATIHSALPEWLTVEQAAKYLKVHRTTIYDLCDRGVLPYFELKGARGRRFKREDLDALLEPAGREVLLAELTRRVNELEAGRIDDLEAAKERIRPLISRLDGLGIDTFDKSASGVIKRARKLLD